MISISSSSRALARCSSLTGSRSRLGPRGMPAASPTPAPFQWTSKQQQQQQQGRGAAARAAAGLGDRAAHMQQQRDIFNNQDTVDKFLQPLPADILQRLERVASSVPGLGPSSRVVDVGTGTGCLIPHIQGRGVRDIVAVDLCENMLARLGAQYGTAIPLGNEAGVRTWCGDVVDLPPYIGPVDAFFFNGVFGNLHSQSEGLLRAALLLRPGGHIVLSHVMGRAWHAGLHTQDPGMVPHELPGRQALEEMVRGLPLEVVGFVDEPELYVATLRLPPGYSFPGSPLPLAGRVVPGFGRGSRQMGAPTANLDPAPLADALRALPRGVYFGWACLEGGAGGGTAPAADGAVHKMVMNIGQRPTASQGDEGLLETVEVHVMHDYSQDFYGRQLRVLALGFIRPEMRFAGGLPELIARIKTDIGIAKGQLDDPAWAAYKADPRLLH